MSYISPILSNSLKHNNKNGIHKENNFDKVYDDLTRHANDVKPNAPKARLVKGGVSHSIKNTLKDGKNFFVAVKDGKLSDNNLGRINDLGMKLGALVIASFLASRAKTKTDAIMQFVGGTTFFASMSLWPKLFINLPAKIVHGLDIGDRYISAQGDEKDIHLDNQFYPTDVYSEKDLREMGKRTGIDYDSPNGKEKILRKKQKLALQNRTLWMATAGFATPLLTAMTGNIIEPKIKNAVIDRDYKKARDIITPKPFMEQSSNVILKSGLEEYLSNAKADVRNVDGIENLFKEYSAKNVDDLFFKRLGEMLQINTPYDNVKTKSGEVVKRSYQMFKDQDSNEAIKNFHPNTLVDALRNIQSATAIVKQDSLSEALENIKSVEAADNLLLSGAGIPSATSKTIDVKQILEDFSKSADKTLNGLRKILENKGLSSSQISSVEKRLTFDNSTFFETIKEYNKSVLPEVRGRFKAYMNLFNSVMGSKTESMTTKEYLAELDKLMKRLDFSYDDLGKIINQGVGNTKAQEYLTDYFKAFAERTKNLSKEEYQKELGNFLSVSMDADLLETTKEFVKGENIESIVTNAKSASDNEVFKNLNNALIGIKKGEDSDLLRFLTNFKNGKIISIEAIKAKALICSNFERRVANGEFKTALEDARLLSGNPEQIKGNFEKLLSAARLLVYDGSSSVYANKANLGNEEEFNVLKGFIYDSKKFDYETSGFNIKEVVENLGKIDPNKEKDYLRSLSFSDAIRKRATEIYNNKSWARIFVPMTAALIAVTLLVQPFFGKIKNEFPEEENKNGGVK